MDTQSAISATARVPTPMARRYMGQLCKHFEHKLPVNLSDTQGQIEFSVGLCLLKADADSLVIRVTAGDPDALARLEDVVARHLQRFAFRENIELDWTPPQ